MYRNFSLFCRHAEKQNISQVHVSGIDWISLNRIFTFSSIYFENKGFFFCFFNMKIVIILLKFEVILVLFFQVLKFESVLLTLTLTVVGI